MHHIVSNSSPDVTQNQYLQLLVLTFIITLLVLQTANVVQLSAVTLCTTNVEIFIYDRHKYTEDLKCIPAELIPD